MNGHFVQGTGVGFLAKLRFHNPAKVPHRLSRLSTESVIFLALG